MAYARLRPMGMGFFALANCKSKRQIEGVENIVKGTITSHYANGNAASRAINVD